MIRMMIVIIQIEYTIQWPRPLRIIYSLYMHLYPCFNREKKKKSKKKIIDKKQLVPKKK
jgi:hypothetical protein